MIHSMTGYGEAEVELVGGRLRATVKTVNHRFFNAHLRTPSGFDRFEPEIQQWLKTHFSRGHVNLTVTLEWDQGSDSDGLPTLDLNRARHYRDLLGTLMAELDLHGKVELPSILRYGDIFQAPSPEEREVDPELLRQVVEASAQEALAARAREGSLLEADMKGRLEAMASSLATIERRAPARLLAERDRLRDAIRELIHQEEVDEDRLAKEIAYLSERWDINEELVRFRAHLQTFSETIGGSEAEPVGKKLGFLVQEMHREANTIGSKANDVEISRASMAIREEIERLREQLENVE